MHAFTLLLLSLLSLLISSQDLGSIVNNDTITISTAFNVSACGSQCMNLTLQTIGTAQFDDCNAYVASFLVNCLVRTLCPKSDDSLTRQMAGICRKRQLANIADSTIIKIQSANIRMNDARQSTIAVIPTFVILIHAFVHRFI